MSFIITPSYEDIFSDERPELSELLSDIPSNVLLRLLSYLDAQLFLNEDIKTQFELLRSLLRRQNNAVVLSILKNFSVLKSKSKCKEFSIFSRLYIKSFIHYVLINYKEGLSIEDTTITQELNIFKAYLIISGLKSSEANNLYKANNERIEGDFFSTHTWSLIINQLDIIDNINPIPNIIRGVCLLNYLQYHSNYSDYVISFLNKKGFNNTWEYVLLLSNAIQLGWEKNNVGSRNYYIVCDEKFRNFFDSISIDPFEYRDKYLYKKEEYSLLKSKPLYKFENQYYVLDWNFIPNKIYEGLIFDFHNDSGINVLPTFNTIPNFKKFIGLEITEKYIFRTILNLILLDKYSTLIFPKDKDAGFPDAYYRKGNTILLFEIKDSYFPSKAIASSTYEDIKCVIDEKYNNDKKGTGQLIKQINRLKDKSFEDMEYKDLNIKIRNFKIYPIIIYTDKFFGMYGVSNYLIKEFNNKIEQVGLRNTFKKINNLTFLSLDYLILHSGFLSKNNIVNIIDRLHTTISNREKKSERIRTVEVLMEYNINLERILDESNMSEDDSEMVLKQTILRLNMTEGLPLENNIDVKKTSRANIR